VTTLLVAAAIAYWEFGNGREDLSWVVIGIGIFMVISMWVFPEADGKKPRRKN
jgi:predicted membrane protein